MAVTTEQIINWVLCVIIICILAIVIICSLNTWDSNMSNSAKYANQIVIGAALFASTALAIQMVLKNNKRAKEKINDNINV